MDQYEHCLGFKLIGTHACLTLIKFGLARPACMTFIWVDLGLELQVVFSRPVIALGADFGNQDNFGGKVCWRENDGVMRMMSELSHEAWHRTCGPAYPYTSVTHSCAPGSRFLSLSHALQALFQVASSDGLPQPLQGACQRMWFAKNEALSADSLKVLMLQPQKLNDPDYGKSLGIIWVLGSTRVNRGALGNGRNPMRIGTGAETRAMLFPCKPRVHVSRFGAGPHRLSTTRHA